VAIAIANDSDYGLCGSVWTSDVEHAAVVGAQVRTGVVAVNSSMILDFNSPFGGFKQSGIGRELGPEGLEPFTELQSIILPAAGCAGRAGGAGAAWRTRGPARRCRA
jgi:betaine-aldehyde dehydrogenase